MHRWTSDSAWPQGAHISQEARHTSKYLLFGVTSTSLRPAQALRTQPPKHDFTAFSPTPTTPHHERPFAALNPRWIGSVHHYLLCTSCEGHSLLSVYNPMLLVAMEEVIMTQSITTKPSTGTPRNRFTHTPLYLTSRHHAHVFVSPSAPGCYKHSCCQPGRCWSITQIRSKAIDKYGCGRVWPTNKGEENA